MKIAVLGSGNIGGTIGKIWLKAGREVIFGVRKTNSQHVQTLQEEVLQKVNVTTIPKAIREADWVLLAIPHNAVDDVMQVNATAINRKVIIDATNRFDGKVGNNIETIKTYAPQSPVYRAFNTMGWEVFADPHFGRQIVDVFFTGPDDENRDRMEELIADTGGRPIWIGDNDLAYITDSLVKLWITLAHQRNMGRRIGLKLLQDE